MDPEVKQLLRLLLTKKADKNYSLIKLKKKFLYSYSRSTSKPGYIYDIYSFLQNCSSVNTYSQTKVDFFKKELDEVLGSLVENLDFSFLEKNTSEVIKGRRSSLRMASVYTSSRSYSGSKQKVRNRSRTPTTPRSGIRDNSFHAIQSTGANLVNKSGMFTVVAENLENIILKKQVEELQQTLALEKFRGKMLEDRMQKYVATCLISQPIEQKFGKLCSTAFEKLKYQTRMEIGHSLASQNQKESKTVSQINFEDMTYKSVLKAGTGNMQSHFDYYQEEITNLKSELKQAQTIIEELKKQISTQSFIGLANSSNVSTLNLNKGSFNPSKTSRKSKALEIEFSNLNMHHTQNESLEISTNYQQVVDELRIMVGELQTTLKAVTKEKNYLLKKFELLHLEKINLHKQDSGVQTSLLSDKNQLEEVNFMLKSNLEKLMITIDNLRSENEYLTFEVDKLHQLVDPELLHQSDFLEELKHQIEYLTQQKSSLEGQIADFKLATPEKKSKKTLKIGNDLQQTKEIENLSELIKKIEDPQRYILLKENTMVMSQEYQHLVQKLYQVVDEMTTGDTANDTHSKFESSNNKTTVSTSTTDLTPIKLKSNNSGSEIQYLPAEEENLRLKNELKKVVQSHKDQLEMLKFQIQDEFKHSQTLEIKLQDTINQCRQLENLKKMYLDQIQGLKTSLNETCVLLKETEVVRLEQENMIIELRIQIGDLLQKNQKLNSYRNSLSPSSTSPNNRGLAIEANYSPGVEKNETQNLQTEVQITSNSHPLSIRPKSSKVMTQDYQQFQQENIAIQILPEQEVTKYRISERSVITEKPSYMERDTLTAEKEFQDQTISSKPSQDFNMAPEKFEEMVNFFNSKRHNSIASSSKFQYLEQLENQQNVEYSPERFYSAKREGGMLKRDEAGIVSFNGPHGLATTENGDGYFETPKSSAQKLKTEAYNDTPEKVKSKEKKGETLLSNDRASFLRSSSMQTNLLAKSRVQEYLSKEEVTYDNQEVNLQSPNGKMSKIVHEDSNKRKHHILVNHDSNASVEVIIEEVITQAGQDIANNQGVTTTQQQFKYTIRGKNKAHVLVNQEHSSVQTFRQQISESIKNIRFSEDTQEEKYQIVRQSSDYLEQLKNINNDAKYVQFTQQLKSGPSSNQKKSIQEDILVSNLVVKETSQNQPKIEIYKTPSKLKGSDLMEESFKNPQNSSIAGEPQHTHRKLFHSPPSAQQPTILLTPRSHEAISPVKLSSKQHNYKFESHAINRISEAEPMELLNNTTSSKSYFQQKQTLKNNYQTRPDLEESTARLGSLNEKIVRGENSPYGQQSHGKVIESRKIDLQVQGHGGIRDDQMSTNQKSRTVRISQNSQNSVQSNVQQYQSILYQSIPVLKPSNFQNPLPQTIHYSKVNQGPQGSSVLISDSKNSFNNSSVNRLRMSQHKNPLQDESVKAKLEQHTMINNQEQQVQARRLSFQTPPQMQNFTHVGYSPNKVNASESYNSPNLRDKKKQILHQSSQRAYSQNNPLVEYGKRTVEEHSSSDRKLFTRGQSMDNHESKSAQRQSGLSFTTETKDTFARGNSSYTGPQSMQSIDLRNRSKFLERVISSGENGDHIPVVSKFEIGSTKPTTNTPQHISNKLNVLSIRRKPSPIKYNNNSQEYATDGLNRGQYSDLHTRKINLDQASIINNHKRGALQITRNSRVPDQQLSETLRERSLKGLDKGNIKQQMIKKNRILDTKPNFNLMKFDQFSKQFISLNQQSLVFK